MGIRDGRLWGAARLAVAACLLGAVGGCLPYATVRDERGRGVHVTLADGTHVWAWRPADGATVRYLETSGTRCSFSIGFTLEIAEDLGHARLEGQSASGPVTLTLDATAPTEEITRSLAVDGGHASKACLQGNIAEAFTVVGRSARGSFTRGAAGSFTPAATQTVVGQIGEFGAAGAGLHDNYGDR